LFLQFLPAIQMLTIQIAGLGGGIVEITKDHDRASQALGSGFTLYYLVEDVDKVCLSRLLLASPS
jgi:hypothetical protein